MGAIVAYEKSDLNHAFDAAERQAGQIKLGALLRNIGEETRDDLFNKLVNVRSDGTVVLRFEFKDETGNTIEQIVSNVTKRGGDKIVLVLIPQPVGAGPNTIEGVVILTVRSDRREHKFGGGYQLEKRTFHMRVSLPENRELDGFNYLNDISDDVVAINHTTQGGDYLTAFKLLSRCK